jgi:hypothetical protein
MRSLKSALLKMPVEVKSIQKEIEKTAKETDLTQ